MTPKPMTLVQEIDAVKYEDIPLRAAMEFDDAVEVCTDKVRTFADNLEGEEILEDATDAIYDAALKRATFSDGKVNDTREFSKLLAKAALAVVREMVG